MKSDLRAKIVCKKRLCECGTRLENSGTMIKNFLKHTDEISPPCCKKAIEIEWNVKTCVAWLRSYEIYKNDDDDYEKRTLMYQYLPDEGTEARTKFEAILPSYHPLIPFEANKRLLQIIRYSNRVRKRKRDDDETPAAAKEMKVHENVFV